METREEQEEMSDRTDIISRQEAIEEVCKVMKECFSADDEELDAIEVTINELLSVQSYEKVDLLEMAKALTITNLEPTTFWIAKLLELEQMGYVICRKI